MNRITVERVKNAARKCKKPLTSGDWYDTGSVCPLSALYLEDHTLEDLIGVVERSHWDNTRADSTVGKMAKAFGLSIPYVTGFYHGVDNYYCSPISLPGITDNPDYELGKEDGGKVRQSLLQEVEETPDLVHAEP